MKEKKNVKLLTSLLLAIVLTFSVTVGFAVRANATVTYTINYANIYGTAAGLTNDVGSIVAVENANLLDTLDSQLPLSTGYYWVYTNGTEVSATDTVTQETNVMVAQRTTVTYTINYANIYGTAAGLTNDVGSIVADENANLLDTLNNQLPLSTGYYWVYTNGTEVSATDIVTQETNVMVAQRTTVTYTINYANIYGTAAGLTNDVGSIVADENANLLATLNSQLPLSTGYYWVYTNGTKVGDTDTVTSETNVMVAQETVTHTHTYATPSDSDWTWASDYSSATVTVSCSCGTSETLKATVASKTTDATATTAGEIVYTATATVNGQVFTTTKTVTIPATGTSGTGSGTTSTTGTSGTDTTDTTATTTVTDTTNGTVTTTSTTTDSSSTSTVKTGVEDNMVFYVMAIILGMGVAVPVMVKRRKMQ